MIGNLDLLRKSAGDNPRTIRLIEGAERGATLTQRLLAFTRRQELKVEPRILSDLILGMTDLIDRSLGPAIDRRITLPQSAPPALVDVNQFELAVLNLLVNARDAMPDGGVVSIEVDIVRPYGQVALPEAYYVRVIVIDTATEWTRNTGEGDGTVLLDEGARQGHGPGFVDDSWLGIAAWRRLATVERGRTWYASRALAACREGVRGHGRQKHRHAGAGKLPPTHNVRATILVDDDDPLISMSAVDMIEDLGHHAIEANSGDDAIALLQGNEAVDLVLTDYSMPRMNGAELARRVMKMRPGMPILVASGYAELPVGEGRNLPRIAKPFHQEQLAIQLQKLLTDRKGD